MSSLVRGCALAALLTSLTAASIARADSRLDVPRISGLYGLQLVVGPEVETNGLTEGHPVIFMPLPTPQLALRLDVPLLLGLEAGFEARGFAWTTLVEEDLGYDVHYTGDLSLVPAYAFTADAGIVYHRLTHRIDYRGAEPTTDVIVYQPFDLFVRLGVVLHLGG